MTLHNRESDSHWNELDLALRRIISIWPKPDGSEPADFREQLASRLAPGFDELDFVNKVTGVAELKSVTETPEHLEIQFYDVNGYLHKAVFVPHEGFTWRLRSLKFQCPICFGSGVNDGETCKMCGGAGWGVS